MRTFNKYSSLSKLKLRLQNNNKIRHADQSTNLITINNNIITEIYKENKMNNKKLKMILENSLNTSKYLNKLLKINT